MKMLSTSFSLAIALTLSSCGSQNADTSNEAENFAARINGNVQAEAPVAPTIAPPREIAEKGASAPDAATEPVTVTCNADKMGPFIGRGADDATRLEVMTAAAGASDVRFITPGSDYVRSDQNNPRLNLMLDAEGVIRDAKCG